jgi:phosphate transport system substrate-binding protein
MGTRLICGAALFGALAVVTACGGSSTSGTPTAAGTPTPAAVHTGNPTAAVTLKESGSSLMFPYLQQLVTPLTTAYSNITLQPAAGGSGKGITDTIAGASDLGGSDAYLSPGQMAQNPNIANIPVVVSAQDVYVNVPGVSSLKLNGDVLAKIYMGQITKWNDRAIAALNSGATLPATGIVPVRRVDSSGDTFLFTSFLAATNQAWANGPSIGTTVTWPSLSSEVTANGNPGMVTACKANPGCVAYVGISAQSSANSAALTLTQLQNKAGSFLNANPATMAAAVDAVASSIPSNLAQSLIYQGGAQSYPIVNYEYLMVNTSQTDANKALAIRTLLAWAIDPNGGSQQSYLSQANFIALPDSVISKVKAGIASIKP